MSDLLLNKDLQVQSPSAQETESGNAIVTLYEVYLADSDIGGSGIDKLYFHDGTKSPGDSYASIQMYSPSSESDWGSTFGDRKIEIVFRRYLFPGAHPTYRGMWHSRQKIMA